MALLAGILDGLDSAAVVFDAEGVVVACSARGREKLGSVASWARVVDALAGDGPGRFLLEELARDARRGCVREITVPRGLLAEGVALELRAGPLVASSRGAWALLWSSPLERATRAEQAARVARMASAGQLVEAVTHELNNVVTAIAGWARVARAESAEPAAVRAALEVVDESCQRARSIVEGLGGLTRAVPDGKGTVSLARVADDVVRVLSWELVRGGVKVERSYSDLPLVRADRGRLQQVVVNLVLNALQAMPEGGELRLATALCGDDVELSVRDDGCGMDEATVARVFEPHFTTKQPSPGGLGGSGLGLSISRSIVFELGGDIAVESYLGRGSTFRVRLPAAREPAAAPAASGAREPELPAGLAILVVEGSDGVRAMEVTALASRGANVVEASTVAEAVARCEAGSFDLAVVDDSTPGAARGGAARRLGQRCPGLRLVLTTGGTEHEAATAPPGAVLLRKPFGLEDLVEAVATALEDRSGQAPKS